MSAPRRALGKRDRLGRTGSRPRSPYVELHAALLAEFGHAPRELAADNKRDTAVLIHGLGLHDFGGHEDGVLAAPERDDQPLEVWSVGPEERDSLHADIVTADSE